MINLIQNQLKSLSNKYSLKECLVNQLNNLK